MQYKTIKERVIDISNDIKTIHPNSKTWYNSMQLIVKINGKISNENFLKVLDITSSFKKKERMMKLPTETTQEKRHRWYLTHRDELLNKAKMAYYKNKAKD